MNKKYMTKYVPSLFFPMLLVLLLAISINVPAAFASDSSANLSAFQMLDELFQQYLSPTPVDEKRSSYTDEQLEEMTSDLQTFLDQCDITTKTKEMEAITRYVAQRTYYDLNDSRYRGQLGTENCSDKPYDVWKSKKALCGGYTSLLNTLLTSRGIPSYSLTTKNHGYTVAYNEDYRCWIYIDATGYSGNTFDLERDPDTNQVLPNANEEWTMGTCRTIYFDLSVETLASSPSNCYVFSCDGLVKDGLQYGFRCSDRDFNTEVNTSTWANTENWQVALLGPWNECPKNLKVAGDVGGLPVARVYNGFAGTDIESVDFSETDMQRLASIPGSNTGTFEGCKKLKTVKLPDSIRLFGTYTFADCTALEEINMPKSTKNYPPAAFSGCSSLKTVDFRGSTLTNLEYNLFENCTSLSSVYLGKQEQLDISYNVFYGCTNLETFDCAEANITSVGNYAFYNCSKLKKIDLSSSTMEQTGQSIFRDCTSLAEVILPGTLKEINYLTFSGTAVKTLDLRDTAITKIELLGCGYMNELETLYLPDTLEELGDNAFALAKSTDKILYIYSKISESDIRAMAKKADGVWSGRYISFPKGTYTITYDGNGATAGTMETQTCIIDNYPFNLAQNAYTKDGFTFAGWNTAADGSGTSYKDGERINDLTKTDQDEITLYATWKDRSEIEYNIKYVLNINNAKNNNPKTYTNKSDTIVLNAATLDGYIFKGWFSDKTFTKQVTEIAAGSTGDITLYALWEKADTCNHEWVQMDVIERATCSHEGTATRICTKCKKNEVITLPIDPEYHFSTQVVNKKAATTTAEGYTGDTICKACKKVLKTGSIIPKKAATTNTPSTSKTPAPSNKPNGSNVSSTKNPAASNTPSATKKPSANASQKASKTSSVTAPKAVKGLRLVNQKSSKLIISWVPDSTVKGYEVQYAMDKKFKKSAKKKTVKANYLIVKKVKKSKTYYVRVRAYKLQGNKKVYGKWTKIKKIKIKQ